MRVKNSTQLLGFKSAVGQNLLNLPISMVRVLFNVKLNRRIRWNTSNSYNRPSPSHRPPGRACYPGQSPASGPLRYGARAAWGRPTAGPGLSARRMHLPVSHTSYRVKGWSGFDKPLQLSHPANVVCLMLFRERNVSKTSPLASQKSDIRLEKRASSFLFLCIAIKPSVRLIPDKKNFN